MPEKALRNIQIKKATLTWILRELNRKAHL